MLRRMAGGADVAVDADGEPLIKPGVVYDTSLPSSVVPARHWMTTAATVAEEPQRGLTASPKFF